MFDMTVTTVLRLEGVISARGETSTTASGGSGGSIRIQTNEMEGSGSVQVGLWCHPLSLVHNPCIRTVSIIRETCYASQIHWETSGNLSNLPVSCTRKDIWISSETKIFLCVASVSERSPIHNFTHAHNNNRSYFNEVLCRLDNGGLTKYYPCALLVALLIICIKRTIPIIAHQYTIH